MVIRGNGNHKDKWLQNSTHMSKLLADDVIWCKGNPWQLFQSNILNDGPNTVAG